MTKIRAKIIPKIVNPHASKAKISKVTLKDTIIAGSTASAVVTAPVVLAQYKTIVSTPKLYPNGTMIESKEFPSNDRREPSISELYSRKKKYPYYDEDYCIFTKEANPDVLPIKDWEIKDEVIYVSNLDIPNGTIAGTSTLDKILYTDTLRVCAALAVVDKAHNTQTLIHVFPGFNKKTNKQIIEHIISACKPEDLELSVVSGYYPGTDRTLQFIFDTLKEITPNNTPNLYNFPKEIDGSKRGLLLHNGELSCCDMENVKNKKTNPIENITYSKYEEIKYAKAKDLEEILISLDFPQKFNKNNLKVWAINNNLKRYVYNDEYNIEFKDADGKVVREVRADYYNKTAIRMELRYFYDNEGNKKAIIINRQGYITCEYDFGLKKRTILIGDQKYNIITDKPQEAILINGVWCDSRHKKLQTNPITGKPQ